MTELMSLVYANDPNGGPDDPVVLRNLIHRARKKLAPQGYTIVCWPHGKGGRYRLIPLKHQYADKHYHGTAGMLSCL
jgi:hypothetical protein